MIENPSLTFPISPGCYLMRDGVGTIIYIGKAKSLRKRVSSYFAKTISNSKTFAQMQEVASIDFIATDNEIEALILEANLIRKHSPKYNIDLKGGQRYAYLKVTEEKFPRVISTRQKTKKGKYIGPFTDALARRAALQICRKVFLLRSCQTLPKKECLYYHIGQCSAPCIGAVSEEQYLEQVRKATRFLSGDVGWLVQELSEKMGEASKTLLFEKAKEYRDQLRAIEYMGQRQKAETHKEYNQDVIVSQIDGAEVVILLFTIVKGVLTTKQTFRFPRQDEIVDSFVKVYYSSHPVPREIILEKELDDPLIAEYLQTLSGACVNVLVPERGEKKQLLSMMQKNAMLILSEKSGMMQLQEDLRLPALPVVMECFDISNTSGTNSVASMVQFKNGKPHKSQYRKFIIRDIVGPNDFASIAQVVARRYKRLLAENKQMPDLIVIDGGQGQLHAALDELHKLELKIPIIGLAKRLEEIYTPGLSFPLHLEEGSAGLLLLQHIRDEAHRFAITFHRKRRSKGMLE